MSEATLSYRWTPEGFLRAWEAGAFDRKVELIDGEVIPVVVGDWHGATTARVVRALPADGVDITTQTLPAGASLPDPDCWVRRASAQPVDSLGDRLSVWAPNDVLLVVEVADETVTFDLTVKARLYGAAGFVSYWVVTRDAVYEHTDPRPSGYGARHERRPSDALSVPYASFELAVGDLIGGDRSERGSRSG